MSILLTGSLVVISKGFVSTELHLVRQNQIEELIALRYAFRVFLIRTTYRVH